MSDQNTNEQSKYQQVLSYKVHNTNGQKYQQKKWSKYHFAGIMIIGILNVGILILTHEKFTISVRRFHGILPN